MKAVVMAGGFGTRIQPLTNSRPKPMLPVVNKPMMEHTMMTLRSLKIILETEVILVSRSLTLFQMMTMVQPVQ